MSSKRSRKVKSRSGNSLKRKRDLKVVEPNSNTSTERKKRKLITITAGKNGRGKKTGGKVRQKGKTENRYLSNEGQEMPLPRLQLHHGKIGVQQPRNARKDIKTGKIKLSNPTTQLKQLQIDLSNSDTETITDNKKIILKPKTPVEIVKNNNTKKENPKEDVQFEICKNLETVIDTDNKIHILESLCGVRNVYCEMIPDMPPNYVSRLVFDRSHVSLVGRYRNIVMCGITFKPFVEQGFIEIAFVAVNGKYQIKGVGSKMMSRLKEYCVSEKFYRMITCADNNAVGFFQKQGFSKNITLAKKRYEGYIKDYISVTLMECVIREGIDYVNFRKILAEQKNIVKARLTKANEEPKVYPGISNFSFSDFFDIPGVKESGWEKPKTDSKSVKALLLKIVNFMSKQIPAWPFLEPVDPKEIIGYDEFIKNPMDLKTLRTNVIKNKYKNNIDKFHHDMLRIFENCRIFNDTSTPYYKCADDCEKLYLDYIKRSSVNLKYFLKERI